MSSKETLSPIEQKKLLEARLDELSLEMLNIDGDPQREAMLKSEHGRLVIECGLVRGVIGVDYVMEMPQEEHLADPAVELHKAGELL